MDVNRDKMRGRESIRRTKESEEGKGGGERKG